MSGTAANGGGLPTVILVDDHRERLLELSLALASRGIAVHEAETEALAVAAMDERHFDGAVVSLDLRGGRGLNLVEKLARSGTGTIALSQAATAPRSAEVVRAGALDLELAPVESEGLADHLAFVVSESAMLRTAV